MGMPLKRKDAKVRKEIIFSEKFLVNGEALNLFKLCAHPSLFFGQPELAKLGAFGAKINYFSEKTLYQIIK
jgi:hypothetical protein